MIKAAQAAEMLVSPEQITAMTGYKQPSRQVAELRRQGFTRARVKSPVQRTMRGCGMNAVFICSFTSGIDELPRKEQAQFEPVLRVLDATGRFSVFEATANQTIAKTMTRLMASEYVEDLGGSYPWKKVRLTDAGKRLITTPAAPKGGA